MLSRFIYDYIYKNKYITIIYMGYKQKLRERRKKAEAEEQRKKLLNEWVLIDNNVVKSVARPRPLS
tara:strand:- start:1962 stop:2159 length:198 start_codon:yes stop_codon:yes gene_type:complete